MAIQHVKTSPLSLSLSEIYILHLSFFFTDNSDICFHPNSGRNISFLDKERRSAKLDVEFPAVTCCLWRKLRVNEYMTLSVLPLRDGEKDPSRYHVVLGVSQLDPAQLRSRDPESFRSDSRVPMPYRWKVINRFDRDVCYGEVRVGVSPQGRIRAFHTGGFETEMDFDPEVKSSEYLFVLSLFRTEVRIKDLVLEESPYDYALQSFRKTSRKYTESLYTDIVGDDVPVNCDQLSEQEPGRGKSQNNPMVLPAQTGSDVRTSFSLRPRQPSDNHYDDVAVGIPGDPTEGCQTEPVYCDVIDDVSAGVTENISDQVGAKSNKEDVQKNESPKVAKKKTKSPLNIRKPVSKLMDKVQGIKNVFVKRAEHPYDDIIDPEVISRNDKPLNTTLRSVPSSGSDVEENTYWEVMEIPREKEKPIQINGVLALERVKSSNLSGSSPSLTVSSPEDKDEVTVRDRKRKDSRTKDRPNSDPLDKSEGISGKVIVPEVNDDETGNRVNVKLLIQKFGGNDQAVRERNPGRPVFHTSPSAPVLVKRSNSDETLLRHDTQRCQSELYSNAEETNKKPGLLTETFDNINLLLSIGKGKQRKNKGKLK